MHPEGQRVLGVNRRARQGPLDRAASKASVAYTLQCLELQGIMSSQWQRAKPIPIL